MCKVGGRVVAVSPGLQKRLATWQVLQAIRGHMCYWYAATDCKPSLRPLTLDLQLVKSAITPSRHLSAFLLRQEWQTSTSNICSSSISFLCLARSKKGQACTCWHPADAQCSGPLLSDELAKMFMFLQIFDDLCTFQVEHAFAAAPNLSVFEDEWHVLQSLFPAEFRGISDLPEGN